MSRGSFLPLVLAGLTFFSRPTPRTSVESSAGTYEALRILASGESSSRDQGRAFSGDFRHWDQAGTPPGSASRTAGNPEPPPLLAAVVGLLGVLGLRHASGLALYLAADEAEERGDSALHAICIEAAPLVDPHFVQASLLLAWLHQTTDPDRSIRILESARKWNPEDWEISHDLAWIYLRGARGRPRDLERVDFHLAAARRVKHPQFVNRLHARVMATRGDGEGAVRLLEEIASDPFVPEPDRAASRKVADTIRSGVDVLADTRSVLGFAPEGGSR